jgi:hypothetical protein
MALFGSGRTPDVGELIARRRFPEAIELLRARLEKERYNSPLRLQLADVLVLAGRGLEAVPVYLGLADEFAADGFAARAIALLKKAQKIEPGRSDVEARLASFLKGERPAPVAADPPRPAVAETAAAYEPSGSQMFEPSEIDVSRVARPTTPAPGTIAPGRKPVREFGLPMVFDPTPLPAGEEDSAAAEYLREELLDTIQDVLRDPLPAAEPSPSRVKSPLFEDLAADELKALIQGLRLLTFGAGDIILHQGDEPGSMFVITSGRAKAFIREIGGRRHVLVSVMDEGEFFGEMSLMHNEPRSATVTAAADCELLELDRPTMEDLCRRHPHVAQVLEDFAQNRLMRQREALARSSRTGRERA